MWLRDISPRCEQSPDVMRRGLLQLRYLDDAKKLDATNSDHHLSDVEDVCFLGEVEYVLRDFQDEEPEERQAGF
ncbi:unnamed protein product [Ilex paraguariensis]|uniref:Uncharacterized protein n=1 Tax=Ilex paraguariensis TaxID=185542 RepID=A0ABC8RMR5_9AQUA